MSLVGPRPEVRKYVEMFRDDYAEILRVRPGITDPASIKYRNEAEILGRADRSGERIRRARPAGENPPGEGVCREVLALARFRDYLEDDSCRGPTAGSNRTRIRPRYPVGLRMADTSA